ncbi:MAG: hypothetical protein OSB43_06090 [Nocardioides sp.]|uniref:WD40 repeat domain-containing protein n=1 Tax=Nocardioides sp. TaxID=35761 RepID=UPI0023895E1B|nr:hypothetical protein [Nocardioides sp.]MDE0775820.1 hypothetical protein [Nocardioides sp.]
MTPGRGLSAVAASLAAAALLTACSDSSDPADSSRSPGTSGLPDVGAEPDVPMLAVATDDLAITSDGTQLIADCRPGICRWDTGTGEVSVARGSHLALGEDGTVAGVRGDATVVLVDIDSGTTRAELEGLDSAGSSPAVAFSATGALLAAGNDAGRVVVWQVDTRDVLASFEVGDAVYGLAFDADERRLAVTGETGTSVHDSADGAPLSEVAGAAPGAAVAWSPDGAFLATSGSAGSASVWRTDDYEEVASLDTSGVERLAFSPDSRTLAVTTLADLDVTLWHPAALRPGRTARAPRADEVQRLSGLTSAPGAVVFSPDGETVYAVADPDGVRAWSTSTAEPTLTFDPPP